ncbi:hypothetical protein C0J52_18762 [Blattella germanica]|nr:hypothetical protein C0J52_18762 [Blattella germanica]
MKTPKDEDNPTLRRVQLAPPGIKLNWKICRAKDYIAVTLCFKCQEFKHISKYCQQDDQSCSNCAGSLISTRNRAMETLSSRITYPYKNHKSGCTILFLVEFKQEHEINCIFTPRLCTVP